MAKNPLKIDPTRTVLLRRSFVADMNRRFGKLRRIILKVVGRDNALTLNVELRTFDFQSDPSKLTEFNNWFKSQIDENILTTNVVGDPWTSDYVSSAYTRGVERSYIETHKLVTDSQFEKMYVGTKESFIRSSFFAPEMVSKLRLVSIRTFEELNGITTAMSQQMSRILADGLARGENPLTIARTMAKTIDTITSKRARVLARTEVIRAHAEGSLDSYTRLGITEVGAFVEWSTAEDERVCEQCEGMSGEVYSVEDAHGLIPLHPNCRCAWLPVIASTVN